MAAGTQGGLDERNKTLLITGAPLLLALVVILFKRDFQGVEAEVATALTALWSSTFWTFLGGSIGALLLLYMRLQQEPQAVPTAPRVSAPAAARTSSSAQEVVDLLVQGDFREALERGLATQVLDEDQVSQLRQRLSASDDMSHALGNLKEVLESMGVRLTTLAESLHTQVPTTETLVESARSALAARAEIAASIEGLSNSTEESSSSVLEMVAINNEVRENIHNLAMSVQETTTAIEEMTFSSKEVAKNIEDLSTAAEETAASMNEMDVSISQVETNANETSKLSETVTRDAETGVQAINHTIQGIDKIKESSRIAAEVITNLGQRINEIGNILNVIDDVAEQTNLLALNAAIIAAQAGEHGRGFAVVADEIKALAERTGASTKEIASLIKTIQDESRNAVNVMSRGVEDVEEGVRLGHNAEDALRKIVDSAKRSTLMIQAIAQATVEQAKGSKQVTNAISRIAETVQQIAYASAEQAKGSEHIMQSAERMKMITQQVERSADEQNRGGRQITQAIENIRDMADQITSAQGKGFGGEGEINDTSKNLQVTAARLTESAQELERLLGTAAQGLDTLTRAAV